METLEQVVAAKQPVIFLKCGHAWTVESLDRVFELDKKFYVRSEAGAWSATRPLPPSHERPTCPSCRKPIAGVFRYHRPIQHAQILGSAHKFTLQTRRKLDAIRSEIPGCGAKFDLLLAQVEAIIKSFDSSPLALLLERTQLSLARQREEGNLVLPGQGLGLNYLRGDNRSLVEARAVYLELLAEGQRTGAGIEDTVRQQAVVNFEEGMREVEQYSAPRTGLALLMAYGTYATACLATNFAYSASEAALEFVVRRLQEVSKTQPNLAAEASQLRQRLADLKPKGLSPDEMRQVFNTLKAELPLEGGFGGHWYTCPNGHIYAIGDCGGAMERSSCPECGEEIGGQQHRVVDSNRPATAFLEVVRRGP